MSAREPGWSSHQLITHHWRRPARSLRRTARTSRPTVRAVRAVGPAAAARRQHDAARAAPTRVP
eukprot:2764902-Prymnesium_polylepis.1